MRPPDMTPPLSPTEAMKLRLRNDFRIKYGTDYSLVHKYGKTVITCFEVYKDRIEAVAEEHGVKVDRWFLLPNNF